MSLTFFSNLFVINAKTNYLDESHPKNISNLSTKILDFYKIKKNLLLFIFYLRKKIHNFFCNKSYSEI